MTVVIAGEGNWAIEVARAKVDGCRGGW